MPSLDFSRQQLVGAPAQAGRKAPLWKEAGNLFTVRYDKSGRRCIVKKRSVPWWVHSLSTLPVKGCRWHSACPAALPRSAGCCICCTA